MQVRNLEAGKTERERRRKVAYRTGTNVTYRIQRVLTNVWFVISDRVVRLAALSRLMPPHWSLNTNSSPGQTRTKVTRISTSAEI
jgi:hypothetical protein